MERARLPLDWTNILFLTFSPFIALVWSLCYALHYGTPAALLWLFMAMYLATGFSITAGYHRYFTHSSYKASTWLKVAYLVFGACALENSVVHWADDHRLHHRYTDTDNDPYQAGRGFWYSHMGWIFYQTPKNRDFSMVEDLLADPWVRWQHRHILAVGLMAGLGLPLAIGLAIGHPIGALLWGGLIRIVAVHHATFSINSLAHMVGGQPYSKANSSHDNSWLALLTNGEGYHNFHHKFPSDYRNGVRWYQWDPTKWLIAALSVLRVTRRLHRTTSSQILKARLDVEALNAEICLGKIPDGLVEMWRSRLASARQSLEQTLAGAEARKTYGKAQWKKYLVRLEEDQKQWRELIRNVGGAVPRT
jgi:stearoyl-CoA desaturase (delta-9 desaturase)